MPAWQVRQPSVWPAAGEVSARRPKPGAMKSASAPATAKTPITARVIQAAGQRESSRETSNPPKPAANTASGCDRAMKYFCAPEPAPGDESSDSSHATNAMAAAVLTKTPPTCSQSGRGPWARGGR